MHVVSLYAALLALLFVALSIRTLRMRRRLRIAVGDAGNQAMLKAIRAHSNFSEYVPLSLFFSTLLNNRVQSRARPRTLRSASGWPHRSCSRRESSQRALWLSCLRHGASTHAAHCSRSEATLRPCCERGLAIPSSRLAISRSLRSNVSPQSTRR